MRGRSPSPSNRVARRRRAEPPANSPLLTLPAELRNEIYRYAFKPSDSADPSLPGTRASDLLRPLLACRQIYEEARALAFSCVSFAVENVTGAGLAARLSVLRTEQTQAIRSMTYSNYRSYDGYNHMWLRGMVEFRPDNAGIVLEELSLRPGWEDEEILPLISREDEAVMEDIRRGPVAELARSVLATVRNLQTLKRINILCDGLLLEKDVAALIKELRTEFRHPSFQHWRTSTAHCFGHGYVAWAQTWRAVVHDARRWTLLARGSDADAGRSVNIEFRMSDSWTGRHFPPLLPAESCRSSGEGVDEEIDADSNESEEWTSSDGEDEATDWNGSEQLGHDSDGESVYNNTAVGLLPSGPRETFFETSTNWL